MPRVLTEAESAARSAELRDLWNQFDPLGAAARGDLQAYDEHLEPLFRVLEGDGDEQELAAEIRILMQDFMDLDWSTEREAEADVFATRVMAWWNANWADTRE